MTGVTPPMGSLDVLRCRKTIIMKLTPLFIDSPSLDWGYAEVHVVFQTSIGNQWVNITE